MKEIRLQVPEENVAPVVKSLTQLAVKSWLIANGRDSDLFAYSTACELDCQLYEKQALDEGVYSLHVHEGSRE